MTADPELTGGLAAGVDAAIPTIRRVGPGLRPAPSGSAAATPMAADSAFGVALVGLWYAAAQAGGAVGFPATVDRSDVARQVAPMVEGLRTGRALAVAADQGRRLVGTAVLRPGVGTRAHTGRLELLLVEPALTGCGLGRALLTTLLDGARERGLGRVGVEFAQDERVQRFFESVGFEVWGRRPGWQRTSPGADVEEIVMGRAL